MPSLAVTLEAHIETAEVEDASFAENGSLWVLSSQSLYEIPAIMHHQNLLFLERSINQVQLELIVLMPMKFTKT